MLEHVHLKSPAFRKRPFGRTGRGLLRVHAALCCARRGFCTHMATATVVVHMHDIICTSIPLATHLTQSLAEPNTGCTKQLQNFQARGMQFTLVMHQ